MPASGRADELGRSEPVDELQSLIAEQPLERSAQPAWIDLPEAALSGEEGRQPLIEPLEESVVVERRQGKFDGAGEGDPLAQSIGALAPRQDGGTMLAHRLKQRGLNRRLVGFGVRSARQADRAEPAATSGCDRAGCRIEGAVVALSICSPKTSRTSASSIAAAERMRAPEA